MLRFMRPLGPTLVALTTILCSPAMAEQTDLVQPTNTFTPISFQPDTVTIHLEQQCMLGDFDAIRHDMMYTALPRLLLSIQAIDSGAEVTQLVYSKLDGLPEPQTVEERQEQGRVVQEYLRTIYSEGETATLAFPATKAGYIIRLCKDSTQANSCSKKPLVTIQSVLDKLSKVEPGYVPPDVVYFYQTIIKAQDGFSTLTESFQDSDAKNIKELLTKANPAVSPETAGDIVHGLEVTRSLPISDTGHKLTLHLPTYNKEKCSSYK